MKTAPFLQTFLILSLISAFVLALDSFKFLSLPKSAIYFITNPISLGLYKSSQQFGKQFYFIFAVRKTVQQEKAREEQIAQLLSENANIRRKLAETEALLTQQQKLDPRTYNLMPAHPIGVDRFLKIDKGVNDGVKVNQTVVFKDNFIGKVVSVSEKGANIMLARDPDSKIAAFSMGKDGKAKGLLIGQFGSELLMDKILHEETIAVGDLVYSEGTEGFLPRGLVLGQVSEVLKNEHDVFKQAKIKELFDPRDFDLVFLINE